MGSARAISPRTPPVSRPVAVVVPKDGVVFAESVHAHDFSMRPRAEPFHKLIYVLRGRVRYVEDRDASESASSGSVIVVRRGIRHFLVDEQASTLLLLCVSEGFLRIATEIADVWTSFTHGRRVVKGTTASAALESLWRRALAERAHQRAAAGVAVRALALQVFVQLARVPTRQAGDDAAGRIATVRRDIEQTFFERWTIDAAAERAGMSRRSFTSHFRLLIGKTFGEYVTAVRLEHAAQLLRSGHHSVAGAIFASGFGDVSQFYRLFRARFGMTPRAWGEAHGQYV